MTTVLNLTQFINTFTRKKLMLGEATHSPSLSSPSPKEERYFCTGQNSSKLSIGQPKHKTLSSHDKAMCLFEFGL